MEGSTSVGDGHGWSEQLSEREVRAVVLQTRSTAAAAAAPRFLSASVAALLVHSTAAPSVHSTATAAAAPSVHSTAGAVAAPSVHSTATATAAPSVHSTAGAVAAPAVHSIALTSHAYPNPGQKRRYQRKKREAKAAERARGLDYVFTQVHLFCNNL